MKHAEWLKEIPGYSTWTEISPINKGWSSDIKFKVTNSIKESFIVRFSDKDLFERKKVEFESVKKLTLKNLNITRPVDFGLLNSHEKVYAIYTWIDGNDAEQEIVNLTPKEQYQYGRKAGEILKQIHQISAPTDQEPWGPRFRSKIESRISQYEAESVKLEYGSNVIRFLRDNAADLDDRPQTLQHGDFHLGNMVLNPITANSEITHNDKTHNYELGFIDFDRLSYGDPWEEFERGFFTIQKSVPFMNGQIHGYFQDSVPELFFRLMTFYTGYSSIASIPWSRVFGSEEVEKMRKMANFVIGTFNNFDPSQDCKPVWYKKPHECKN